MENRDKSKPFALIVGHKAPHRNWIPAPRHLKAVKEYVSKLTPPDTLMDDYANRPEFMRHNRQSVLWDMCNWNDNHLVEKEIPFEVMKEIVPKWTLRNMINRGVFKDNGDVPANFDMESHKPKFAPKTNLGWNTNHMDPGTKEVYDDFFATRDLITNGVNIAKTFTRHGMYSPFLKYSPIVDSDGCDDTRLRPLVPRGGGAPIVRAYRFE